jgi:hypothetical protein
MGELDGKKGLGVTSSGMGAFLISNHPFLLELKCSQLKVKIWQFYRKGADNVWFTLRRLFLNQEKQSMLFNIGWYTKKSHF